MATFRQISKISVKGVEANVVAGLAPEVILIDPAELFVETEYQRDISAKSINLIRRIIRTFDWAHMKPPICSREDGRLFVIDGQHTAIAAASHPGIDKIPVVVVDAGPMEQRARAFIGHNTNRVAITSAQIYFSQLAAKDQIAMLVDGACNKAGVKILRWPPPHGIYDQGETMAVVSLKKLVMKKGAPGLIRVLKILMASERPIKRSELAAVQLVVYDAKYKTKRTDEELAQVIGSKMPGEWEASVAVRRERDKISLSVALAEAWAAAPMPRKKAIA